MGFIYTRFRPSHFEVMAVTDIKLVFIQILSHSQVTEAIVFFSLQLSSYIPSWRLQKNADGHISSLGDLWYEHELNISLDKVVLSCKNVGACHLHGKPVDSRKYWMNDHCGKKWRFIKCRLSNHRYPESSNPILLRLTSDNEMQSPFAPVRAAAIGIHSISHAFYHWWIRFYLYIGLAYTNSVHDIKAAKTI